MHMAFYNANKAYISGHHQSEGLYVLTAPTDACYMRSTYSTPSIDSFLVVLGSVAPNVYVPYRRTLQFDGENVVTEDQLTSLVIEKPWSGKKWCSYGDSITAIGNTNGTGSWQDYVTKNLGFTTHYGRGIGGLSYITRILGSLIRMVVTIVDLPQLNLEVRLSTLEHSVHGIESKLWFLKILN